MNKTDKWIQLIQTFRLINKHSPKQWEPFIVSALGQAKPIRDMTEQEIQKVLDSINGEDST